VENYRRAALGRWELSPANRRRCRQRRRDLVIGRVNPQRAMCFEWNISTVWRGCLVVSSHATMWAQSRVDSREMASHRRAPIIFCEPSYRIPLWRVHRCFTRRKDQIIVLFSNDTRSFIIANSGMVINTTTASELLDLRNEIWRQLKNRPKLRKQHEFSGSQGKPVRLSSLSS
jgi:hypothetical protein